MNPDGTHRFPDLSPVDKVGIAMVDVLKARGHVDMAMRELVDAVQKLMAAAKGDH